MKLALVATLAVTLASCESESRKLKFAEVVDIKKDGAESVAVVRLPDHIRENEIMACKIYYDDLKIEFVAEFVGVRKEGEDFTAEVRIDPDLDVGSIFCGNQT